MTVAPVAVLERVTIGKPTTILGPCPCHDCGDIVRVVRWRPTGTTMTVASGRLVKHVCSA